MTTKDITLWDFHQDENREHLKDSYPRQDMLFKKILRLMSKWGTILELGFWDGYLLNRLTKAWFDCIGQDISEKNIELTKKQWGNNNVNYLLWKLDSKIIALDQSVKAIIASEVLEHMTDDELHEITNEMYRALPKWWYCILTFPARENLSANSCSCPNCWEIFHKWGHKQVWTEEKIRSTFKQFSKINTSEFVSRTKWTDLKSIVLWCMKAIWSYLLWINKSFLVILEK